MDPVHSIKIHKDSTFAMMLEAQRRGHQLWYMELEDLWLEDGRAWARQRRISVQDDAEKWYAFDDSREQPLDALDVILMRKDPPFDLNYIVTTYLLDAAQRRGALVVNPPAALRDHNEKLATALFPQCCVASMTTRSMRRLHDFIVSQGETVVKPVDSMGGASIFRANAGDLNLNVILETVTSRGSRYVMAQRYIPEITAGDKRILMVAGEAVPFSLARIPRAGEFRGNLAAGGAGHGQPLSARDRWIAAEIGPWLKQQGILFAGLDVIGDYLTEINITSPTCIRELDAQFDLNISGQLFDAIESHV
jgi:glutathione synthase